MKVFTTLYKHGSSWSAPLPDWDSTSTLVLALGSPKLANDPTWLKDLRTRFPQAAITGCSTAGEIFNGKIEDDSVAVAIVKMDKSRLKLACAEIQAIEGSSLVGQNLIEQLWAPDLKGIFVMSDGLNVNGSELVAGLNSRGLQAVTVTGGLAGDGADFKKTWVINDAQLSSGIVTAVGFYGSQVQIGHGSRGGWDIFGPERFITRSKGNVLFELDGQSALGLYKKYLGERAGELPASGLLFPLQIRDHSNKGKFLVRTILSVDEKSGSLIFAGDVPQGWSAQLMKANFDRLVDGAASAADQVLSFPDVVGPSLTIAISCVGRRLVLRERAEEEIEAILDRLPNTHQIGFYSYGEISPTEKFLNCELHNQTMTLTTISEAA